MATKPIEAMSLKEIAAEINDNLRRLEAEQNLRKTDGDRSRYYHAAASASGPKVHIQHVSYQGGRCFSKAAAGCYLSLLREGSAPTFSDPRIQEIEANERATRSRKKEDRERQEHEARRATYDRDRIYAVTIPAQVVYVVCRQPPSGREAAYRGALQYAARNVVQIEGPVVEVQPGDVPDSDQGKIPVAPAHYDFKDPALENLPIEKWPR